MQVRFKKQAIKYLSGCGKKTKKRLKEAIHSLPLGDVKKLKGYENYYRLRVGELRVLYTLEDENIIITDILPRGEVYKRI